MWGAGDIAQRESTAFATQGSGVRIPLSPRAPVAQRIERRLPKPRVGGSTPSRGGRGVAQLGEQRSPKPQVGGSSPPTPARILICGDRGLLGEGGEGHR